MNEPVTPKYKAAYEALRGRILAGRYSLGGRLPTEEDLARVFNVSRVTIRRSLDMLVNEGFLERRQGSGYTLVSLAPPSSTCLTSFTEAMLRAGREPSSRLIEIATFDAGAPETDAVVPELRDGPMTRIVRLRLVDDMPRMLVHTWIPTHLLPHAAPEDFPEFGPEQSILRILSRRFGLEWNAACEDISPAIACDHVAAQLQISPNTPILVQACTAFDDDRIVFYEQVFQAGKVSFNLSGGSREMRIDAPALS